MSLRDVLKRFMFYQKRGNKYGAKSSIYNGRTYHSKFEAGVARELDLARNATEDSERVVEVVPQFSITFWIDKEGRVDDKQSPGAIKICSYRPDFKVKYADGHEEIAEVKGFWTTDALFKWRMTEALYSYKYPDIKLVLIK